MRQAFTLTEMVIVVAILGALAAITIPAYVGHTEKIKDRALILDLEQVRDAIDRYAAEHDGMLPPAGGAGAFRDALAPYLRNGFPSVTAGPAAADPGDATDVKITDNGGEISGEAAPTKGWHYNKQTGQFIINYNQKTVFDPNVDYDEL